MKFFSATVPLFVVLVVFSMANARGADENKFTPLIVSKFVPKPLDSAKASLIKDGMTLKIIVSILGPGWMSPDEGVGVIKWNFTDHRVLNVLPHWDDRDDSSEIITYQGHDGLARMWWGTWVMQMPAFTVKSKSSAQ